MNFTFRFLETQDYYNFLVKWWTDNRFTPPPLDFLPNNGKDGIVVIHDNQLICAGFIYQTSAKEVAWIEFIVSNFEIKDKNIRKNALLFLISKLSEISNRKYIFTNVKNENLIQKFKDSGFQIGSSNTQEMIKINKK
jgi:hypothetical protein